MEESEDLRRIEEMINRDNETQSPEDVEYGEFSDYDDSDTQDDLFELEDFEASKTVKTEWNISDPMQFITEEEKLVIDSCTDPELKELLTLNRTKNVQLMQLYKTIKEILGHCHTNISGVTQMHAVKTANRLVNPKIWRMGMPYFKTADDYPCPRNPDAIRKDNDKEILIYELTLSYRWTEREINRLLRGVAFQYKVNRETELLKQIQMHEKLMKKLEEPAIGQTTRLISELKEKLNRISESDMAYPPRGCEKYLDWQRIAERFLRGKYNDVECQVFWNMYVHPDIKKNRWTEKEAERLRLVAKKYNCQKWDLIAEELGNNRTGFLCCVHYYCKIDPPKVGGRFSEQEDQLLASLVEKYTVGGHTSWAQVAMHHDSGRSRAQLLYRYKYFLSCKDNIQKGKFTAAEDILILVLVDRFGKCFTRSAQYFPNRSMIQIKARYSSNLKANIKKGSFTVDEDKIIMDLVSESKGKECNWKTLVPTLQRSSAQIRQRYNTLAQFLRRNPKADLEMAPRRKWNMNPKDSEFEHLRNIADEFKNCSQIPTLAHIRKRLKSGQQPIVPIRGINKTHEKRKDKQKLTPESPCGKSAGVQSKSADAEGTDKQTLPNSDVDELLTEFFGNSMKREFEKRVRTVGQPAVNARGIVEVLSILKAPLHVPKNYQDNSRLDRIDVDILDEMVRNKQLINGKYVINPGNEGRDRLVPPSLNTLYGMKGLLMQKQKYKNKCAKRATSSDGFDLAAHEKQVLWCINSHLASQPEPIRNQILSEREAFQRRFDSIFILPTMMASLRPNTLLLNRLDLVSSGTTDTDVCSTVPSSLQVKTYQRRKSELAPTNNSAITRKSSMTERFKRKIQEAIEGASCGKQSREQSAVRQSEKGKLALEEANSDLQDLHLLEGFLGSQEEDEEDEITFEGPLSDH